MDCTTFITKLENVSSRGDDQWQACCPGHDDRRASLSISRGDDGRVLVNCHAGCDPTHVVGAMGLTMADLMPSDSDFARHRHNGHQHNGHAQQQAKAAGRIVATYDYCDARGELVYQAVRMDPKDFRQRRPDANGGWLWSVKGCPVLPYRLPDLLASDGQAVFIVEGEKDVHSLESIGLVATCNAGGAGKWRADHAKYLAGKHVVVLADNDAPGRKHAQQVALSLQAIAASIKVVTLPGLEEKGDVSDWIDQHGDSAEPEAIEENLWQLVEATPEWAAPREGLPNLLPDDVREHPGEAPKGRLAIPPYVPFPVEALPAVVRDYIAAAAKAIGCDASFIALPLLACLARVVGNTRVVRLKRTWTEPAIVWASIVGKSGTHKTPALQAATAFINKYQAESIAKYEQEQQQYEQEKALYDRAYAEWRKKKNNDEPPPWEPKEPACIRFCTTDVTIEALADRLAAQDDGILVVRDELSGWLGGIAEYKGGKGSDLGHWLATWSGAPLTVDRKTGNKKMLHVARASVSIVGGIQPGVLRSAVGREHMQDGLCARLLLAMPEAKPVTWTDDVIAESVEAAMGGVFDRLLELEAAADADGNPEPYPLDLTPEAKATWITYYNRHRAELVELDDDLAAAWSKLEAYAARFALIFQLCSWAAGDASGDAIDDASIKAGIALSDWFGGEAKRVYGLFTETEGDREVRELVELIRRKGGRVSPRDLFRSSRKYQPTEKAEKALQGLVEAGQGQWEVTDTATNQLREFVLTAAVDVDAFG